MTRAYVALGSNLQNPLRQLRTAVAALRALPDSQLVRVSAVYSSKAVGPEGQDDVLNAVTLLHTALTPHALLDALQGIENNQGRVRNERWGPRTLDLDLLLYGEQKISDERLSVPHPRLHERDWVLYPLREISDTNFTLPGIMPPERADIATLIANCPDNQLVRTHHRLDLE